MGPIFFLRNYLARQYAKLYPREMFIGVTGMVGKTACVAACNAVLSKKYKTLTTKPGLEPSLNIPSTILKLNPKIKKVVLEMGVKNEMEMDFYLSLVKPKVVILTECGSDGVLKGAEKLFESLGKDGMAIVNWDDPNSRKLARNLKDNVVYFGRDSKNCTIWAGNIQIENFTTTFELNLGVERVKVNFKLLGLHQVYPALAAALSGVVCGIPLTRIKLALESIIPQEHELQAVAGPNGSVILDDTHHFTKSTFDSAIDTLLVVPARRRMVVLGGIKEQGEYFEKLQKYVAQKLYKEKIDFVFLGQGETQTIASELQSLGFWEERLEFNLQNSQLVAKLLKTLGKGDVCLLQGPFSVRLDEVVKRIAKK